MPIADGNKKNCSQWFTGSQVTPGFRTGPRDRAPGPGRARKRFYRKLRSLLFQSLISLYENMEVSGLNTAVLLCFLLPLLPENARCWTTDVINRSTITSQENPVSRVVLPPGPGRIQILHLKKLKSWKLEVDTTSRHYNFGIWIQKWEFAYENRD